MSQRLLDAIQWTFGMNTTEAKAYYRQHKGDRRLLGTIEEGYKKHCKQAFYAD